MHNPPRTYLHPRYGVIEWSGQAWKGHAGTIYGSFFADPGRQQVNLPLIDVDVTLAATMTIELASTEETPKRRICDDCGHEHGVPPLGFCRCGCTYPGWHEETD